MPRGFQLCESEKKRFLQYAKKKRSHRKIADKIKRSKTVVTNFFERS